MHNKIWRLLNEFYRLNGLGYPITSALSRKRFIGEALNGADAQDRAVGSVGCSFAQYSARRMHGSGTRC